MYLLKQNKNMTKYINENINEEKLCCCSPMKIDSELCNKCGHSADECSCEEQEIVLGSRKVKSKNKKIKIHN